MGLYGELRAYADDNVDYDPGAMYSPFETELKAYQPYEDEMTNVRKTRIVTQTSPFNTSAGGRPMPPKEVPVTPAEPPNEQRQVNQEMAEYGKKQADSTKKLSIGIGVLAVLGVIAMIFLIKRK